MINETITIWLFIGFMFFFGMLVEKNWCIIKRWDNCLDKKIFNSLMQQRKGA